MWSIGVSLGHSFDSVLDAARVGADWAWVALYEDIAGPVFGFLRSRGVADAEEAARDVFFEIARGLSEFDGNEAEFQVFVFGLAHQRVQVEKRYPARRVRSALADRVLDRLEAGIDGAAHINAEGVPDDVRRAFEVLTPEQRDVLSLRIIAGLDSHQVASVLNRRVAIVRDLQKRAMNRVRAQYPEPLART